MVIAVASGKGGTGKTTVAVSLAQTLAERGIAPVLLSDCDVEAPNAHLYLNPAFSAEEVVNHFIPRVDLERCTGCGVCAEVCQFNAILVFKGVPKVFPSLCHGCGSCTLQCPAEAIEEIPYQIGLLESGTNPEKLNLRQGLLQEGEPLAVPIINALKDWTVFEQPPAVEIIDSPPGASCPVVAAVRDADYLLLVTEPTPFGLHDLKQAVQVARELGIKTGVIINRVGIGQEDIRGYCRKEGLPVHLEIPLDRKIGEGLARGKTLLEIDPGYQDQFYALWQSLLGAGGES